MDNKTTTAAVKTEVSEAAKTSAPAEETKAAKRTRTTKKAAEAKKTTKKADAAPAKKAEAEVRMVIQYQNNDTNTDSVQERVKAQFVAEGHRVSSIKKLDIYVKPEEYSAYYVINEKFSGRVDLF